MILCESCTRHNIESLLGRNKGSNRINSTPVAPADTEFMDTRDNSIIGPKARGLYSPPSKMQVVTYCWTIYCDCFSRLSSHIGVESWRAFSFTPQIVMRFHPAEQNPFYFGTSSDVIQRRVSQFLLVTPKDRTGVFGTWSPARLPTTSAPPGPAPHRFRGELRATGFPSNCGEKRPE